MTGAMIRLPSDPQEAFRLGLAQPPAGHGPGLAEPGSTWAAGPNEETLLATVRLPGLADARGAYETGRVLRRIAQLLDAARAPAAVGVQFRDNVVAALLAHRSRGRAVPWGGEATVDMFMEMYGRILGFEDAGFAGVRKALLTAANDDRPPR
jgi:hypothetical protein